MRRRAALLGPLCKYDQLSNDVIAALTRPAGPPNHWSECYVDLEHGLALVAGGREGQAIGYLQRAVLAAGQFDHPLTSVALLELGHQALLAGKYDEAAKFFAEATYAAVNNYSGIPLRSRLRRPGRGPPLRRLDAPDGQPQGALPAAGAGHPLGEAESSPPVADLALALRRGELRRAGQSRQAAAMLDEARAAIGRRTMGAGSIGARLNYLTALVAYQQRRIAEGNAAFAAAMSYMQHGSAAPVFRGKTRRLARAAAHRPGRQPVHRTGA